MKEFSENNFNQYSIGFYNLENLFDTKDDPKTLDDDFTASSEKNWNEKRFRKKIKKLGRIISQIGFDTISHPPVIVGVAEVENAYVLKELIASKFLKDKGYNFVHFNSPDERGIDTALLYREAFFTILDKKVYPLLLTNEFGERDYTRDILYVCGMLQNQKVHFLINHWPSRRSGAETTVHKRIAAASKNREIIAEIFEKDSNANIIIMGDFNDDPSSESIKTLISQDLYNPMELLHTKYTGTLNYKGGWNLFDQIIMTNPFLQQHGNSFRFKEAKIFNPKELQEHKEKYKGNPFRTFVGKKYLGGISDHFPVYSVFLIEK